ncbi:MAG: O-antigen ligase family protein [Bacteroidetes bacterium]|nr:O-antigen ligase family protein [Bacteroidota bacterium]
MKLFSIFLALVSLSSGNIQFFVFYSCLLYLSYNYYLKTSSIIPYIFLFLVPYPISFIGQTVWLEKAIYVFSIFSLMYMSFKKRNSFIIVKPWQRYVLFVIVVVTLLIYLPIPIETYLNWGIFTGPEENYISNHRNSHMLGFALPMIIGPVLSIAVVKSFSYRTDFGNLYKILKVFTWIIVVGSLIRYITQIEFIPQGYIASIRNDGFRLSGFMNPDSIGYGKTLLIPLAFIFSYLISKQKSGRDAYLLFFIIISLFITFSRIIVASTVIVMIVIVLYNFRIRIMLKGSLFLFIVISFLIFSGAVDKLVLRSVSSDSSSSLNLSGRDLIYTTGIPIVLASPYVGLRPGGYVSMLIEGVSYSYEGGKSIMVVQSAHSFYLVVALEWGIPFLIFLVGVMIHCIYLLHKTIHLTNKYIHLKDYQQIRTWSVALMGLIVGFLLLGITDFIPYPVVFFLIGLSWSLNLMAKKLISSHLTPVE